jgi:hypothetical protein
MVLIESLNLADAERKLCQAALDARGSIVEAAVLLGITRHALKRRIVKHGIQWPSVRSTGQAELSPALASGLTVVPPPRAAASG